MSNRRKRGGRVTPKKSAPPVTVWPEEAEGLPPLDVVVSAIDGFVDVGDRSPLEIELTISNLLGELGAGRPAPKDDDDPTVEELLNGVVELCLAHLDHDPPRVVVDFLWVVDAFDIPWMGWPLHERLDASPFPARPAWAYDVGRSTVTRAYRIVHETRDGDDIALVGRHASAAHDHVVATYIDRTLGGLATDVLAHPDADRYLELSAESGLTVQEIDPADAAAMIHRAVDRTYQLDVPPAVSDSFSSCVELLEHLLGKLPSDGKVPPEPEPASAAALLGIVDRFLSSLTGMKHRGDDEVLLAAVEFVNDELGGDPLRWTASVTEVMLRAWLPSSGFTEVTSERFAELLSAFVPWAHAEHGWGDRYLAEVRAVLDGDDEEGVGAEIIEQAMAAGVDLDDEVALDAFLDDYLGGEPRWN